MFPSQALRVADPQSSLDCSLTVLSANDGGVAGVVVEVSNPSDEHDVVLKVNSDRSAFIMLTLTDEQGNALSGPATIADTSQAQHFGTVRIARSSSHRWRVPIAGQVSAAQLPERGVSGRLVVNVALLFAPAADKGQPDDADFGRSLLTLYDMDVRFTRAALNEGMGPVTADP